MVEAGGEPDAGLQHPRDFELDAGRKEVTGGYPLNPDRYGRHPIHRWRDAPRVGQARAEVAVAGLV